MFNRSTRRPHEGMTRAGFTLVEVMIATLVFAVGMMAVITMEFSAITAYGEARDQSVATDIGYRVISIMRAEAANWSMQDPGGVVGSMKSIYGPNSPVNNADTDAILAKITVPSWTWQVITPTPVDARMVQRQGARYCVYARGAFSQLDLGGVQGLDVTPTAVSGGGTVDVTPIVQAQIAIVYPGKNVSFSAAGGCNTIANCPVGTNVVDMLDPGGVDLAGGGLAALPPLEQCGWRTLYLGAMVSR